MTITPQDNSAKVIADFVVLAAQRVEYSGGQALYIGFAEPGTNTGSTGWSIKKNTIDANGFVTEVKWASGNSAFDKVWDWRAGSYTYS